MKLKIQKLCLDAITPTYATPGSACFDLFSIDPDTIRIRPNCSATIGTGLAFAIDPGWRVDVYSRSGHGFKNGVRLANCVGKIDSDYRGEVMVRLTNDGTTDFCVNRGDRIAQAELNPVHRAEFVEVVELDATERGAGGFGSTGV